ncbi:hypothetical protein GX48_04728 [Paracoccidioides brasiliensis]|nr:hypothetical protein GX48_04728 [Paracoccidioides brasiliensis]
MYGSKSPHIPPFYSPISVVPPQPEWQQPPAQQAHGPQWPSDHVPPLPPPPPPPLPAVSQPGASSYHPGTYGPMPGASPSLDQGAHTGFPPMGDTSAWGVRFNQRQSYQHPQSNPHGGQCAAPPLPPRPSSAIDHSQSQSPAHPAPWLTPTTPPPQPGQQFYSQNQIMSMTDAHPYFPQQQQQQQPWQVFQDPNFPSNSQNPPPPPPIPTAYQVEQQQNPQGWVSQPTYSDQPSTHHYDLPQQQLQNETATGPPVLAQYGITGDGMHCRPQSSPPANSPPTSFSVIPQSPPVAPTASALGIGGPSDWEHFSGPQEEIDDTEAFNFKTEMPPKSANTFELPSDRPPWTHSEQSKPTYNELTASPQSYAVIEPTRNPSLSPSISPNNSVRGEPNNKSVLSDRADSIASSTISADGSTIIDGVIQAWSNTVPSEIPSLNATQAKDSPLKSSSPIPKPPPIPSLPAPRTQTPEPEGTHSTTPKPEQLTPKAEIKVVDPNEDLDPWYKSSLGRYITMLRKEMAAESDEERFKIFTYFLNKETKLREILYGVEDTTSTITVKPMTSLSIRRQSLAMSGLNTTRLNVPPEERDDVLAYSPGGRPILASALSTHNQLERVSSGDGLHRSASHPTPPLQTRIRQSSLGSQENFSAVSSRNHMSGLPRSVSVPPGAGQAASQNQDVTPLVIQPTTPVYTPFRYKEGPQRGSGPLSFDRPAYQAYSALRQASVAVGRTLARAAAISSLGTDSGKSPSVGKAEHEETFIGLIREKSVAYRGQHRVTDSLTKASLSDTSLGGNKSTIFDSLQALVPRSFPNPAENPHVIELRKELESIQDDFAFIQESIDEWDEQARIKRPELDNQRRARQEESEHHIDSLFNDKEIGYSDINVLEDEFRQTEAQRQLTEERKEFETFVNGIFNPIDRQLKEDICKLQAQYDRAINLLNAKTPASDLLPVSPKITKYELSHIMRIAVELFQKLEVRYDKQAVASLERERRRKKAERRYYVFLGETSLLKQLDKDFDMMEKTSVLNAAREKDNRANTLMDSFDDASMCGLGENQSLLDDIAGNVKRLDARYLNNLGNIPPETEQTMNSALDFVKYLSTDSQSILQSFGIADRALNNADYDVSVSEARVANAEPDIFHRLEEEKKKEDVKIHDDLHTRLDSVKMGHEAIMANIRGALSCMRRIGFGQHSSNSNGDVWAEPQPPPAAPTFEVPPPVPLKTPAFVNPLVVENEQQHRHRKALEDAKIRNAAKGFA